MENKIIINNWYNKFQYNSLYMSEKKASINELKLFLKKSTNYNEKRNIKISFNLMGRIINWLENRIQRWFRKGLNKAMVLSLLWATISGVGYMNNIQQRNIYDDLSGKIEQLQIDINELNNNVSDYQNIAKKEVDQAIEGIDQLLPNKPSLNEFSLGGITPDFESTMGGITPDFESTMGGIDGNSGRRFEIFDSTGR